MTEASYEQVVARITDVGDRIVAIAARGPVAADIDAITEVSGASASIAPLEPGDLAVTYRDDQHVIVRVMGDAQIAILRNDGRVRWVEAGMARVPTSTISRLLLIAGFDERQVQKDLVVEWLKSGASERDIPIAWGELADEALVLYGIDEQVQGMNSDFEVDADELIGALLVGAEIDERSTPAVVRRSIGPYQPPVGMVEPEDDGRITVGTRRAPPISTDATVGPPFQPVLVVAVPSLPESERDTAVGAQRRPAAKSIAAGVDESLDVETPSSAPSTAETPAPPPSELVQAAPPQSDPVSLPPAAPPAQRSMAREAIVALLVGMGLALLVIVLLTLFT